MDKTIEKEKSTSVYHNPDALRLRLFKKYHLLKLTERYTTIDSQRITRNLGLLFNSTSIVSKVKRKINTQF